MKRKPRNAYHHGDLREALLDASMASLAKDGLEAVTLRRIAARVGVSHAAPAHHFPTRDALLVALAGRGYVGLGDAMDAARRNAGSGRTALSAIGIAYVRFALEHPNLFRLMFSSTATDTAEADAEARAAAERCTSILREAVAASCAAGVDASTGTDGSRLPAPALASWALVHGLATLWLDGQVKDFFPGPAGEGRFLAQVEALLT